MLKVRKCTIVMNGSNALSGGTTISMNRLKQILASHLSELDELKGRIHIKKLTLDLGALTEMEFDRDFFERFELVCGRFKEKLIALHHDQQRTISGDDEEKLQYIMDYLYSVEQTANVRKLQRFIKSLKRAPTYNELHELQQAYAKQFSQVMPTEILEILKKLLGEIEASGQFSIRSEHTIKAKNQPFEDDFEQKHLDYLLFLLENTRIDNYWLEQISNAFKKKHKRNIPSILLNVLKNTFDEFQWGNALKSAPAENRYLNEVEMDSLKNYLDLHGEESHRNALFQVGKREQNKTSEQTWFAQLLTDYFHRFKTRMPSSLQEQLLKYNAWKKKRSWEQIDQLERDLLQKKLQNEELEKHSSNRSSTTQKNRGVEEKEYAFILELLENTPINAAWFAHISRAFNKEFGRKIPKAIEEHLLVFSANLQKESVVDSKEIIIDWDLTANWKKTLGNYLRQHPEMGVFNELLEEYLPLQELNRENWQEKLSDGYRKYTTEQLTGTQRTILRKFNRQLSENVFKELFSFTQKEWERALKTIDFQAEKQTAKTKNQQYAELVKVFQEVPISESWLADVKMAYEAHFKVKMPEKLLRVLLELANNRLNLVDSARNQRSTHRKNEQISLTELTKSLRLEPQSEELDELLFILSDANEGQQWSEIQHIIAGFEVYYSKPIPSKLRKLLVAFYKESKKQLNDSALNSDWEFLQPILTEQLKGKEKINSKVSVRSLANEIKQLLSIIDSVPLTHRWKMEIERLYRQQFGVGFSKELDKLLEDFFETLDEKTPADFSVEGSEVLISEVFSVEEWRKYLTTNFGVYGVEQMLGLLANWKNNQALSIQHLTEVYEEALLQRLPMTLNALLHDFVKKNQSGVQENAAAKKRNVFVENLKKHTNEIEILQRIQKELVQEEEMLFFQSMLKDLSIDAGWLPIVIKEYETVFGRKVTVRLREALFAFSQQAKQSFDELETEKKTVRNSIAHLERFLTQWENENGVKQLLELVRKSKRLEKRTCFSQLLNEYRDHFKEEMPVNCQELLLKYSADFEWNTWEMAPAQLRSQLISKMKPELIKLSQEQDEPEKNRPKGIEELSFLLSLLEVTPMDASWLATILKQFKLKFNKELSASIKQLLMDFSIELFAESAAQLSVNDASSDRFFLQMLSDYLSSDLSESEMEWIHTLFLKSKKSVNRDNWIERFVEICAKNEHELSEKTRNQLAQFEVHWQNALTISKGEQLQKVLEALISNYFVKISTSTGELSAVEREKELFTLDFVREINHQLLARFITDWKERFEEEMDPELKGILSEYSMAIQLAEEKGRLKNESTALNSEDDYASLSSEIQQTQQPKNVAEIEKEYLLAMSRELVEGWINKSDLEVGYRHIFGKELEGELNSILEEIARNKSQASELILSEFRNFLARLESTKSVQEMLDFLNEEIDFAPEKWFEVIVKTYEERKREVMPFSHHQLLLNFAQTRKSTPEHAIDFAGQQMRQRTLLAKKWNEFLMNQFEKEITPRNANWKEQADFVSRYLETHNLDVELLTKIVRATLGREIDPEWLNFLRAQERSVSAKRTEQLSELSRDKQRNFRESIIAQIEKLPECRETVELIGLVKASDDLTVDNWFQQLLQTYFTNYAIRMPASHQTVLLGIAQEKLFKEESEAVLQEQNRIQLKSEVQQKVEKYFDAHASNNEKNIHGVLDQIIDHCLNESLEENWIHSFSQKYRQLFQAEVPKELREMLEKSAVESVNVQQTRNPIGKLFKNEVETKIEDFFLAKFEQLPMRKVYLNFILDVVRNSTRNALSTDQLMEAFEDKFGIDFPTKVMELINQWTEKAASKPQLAKLETHIEQLFDNEVFSTDSVGQPEKKSREIRRNAVKSAMDHCLNKSLEENWILSFSQKYKQLFKQEVPKELREMLEKSATESENVQQTRNPFRKLFKNEVETKIEDFFLVKFEQLPMRKVYLNFILDVVRNSPKNALSADQLMEVFENKFGVKLPTKAAELINEWTEKAASKPQLVKLETQLEQLFDNEVSSTDSVGQPEKKSREIRRNAVKSAVDHCLNESLEENWILSFSQKYKQLFKEEVPKELREMLEKNVAESENVQQTRNPVEKLFKSEVKTKIEDFFLAKFEQLPMRKVYLNFILEVVRNSPRNALSTDQLMEAFEDKFGIDFPTKVVELINQWTEKAASKPQLTKLETHLEQLFENEVSSTDSVGKTETKSREIRRNAVKSVIDRCLNESLEENWILSFSQKYKQLFQEEVPKELREMLEKSAAESVNAQETRNEKEHPRKKSIAQKIEDFFRRNSKELPVEKAHENFISHYLKKNLLTVSGKEQLASQFEERFGMQLPEDFSEFLDHTVSNANSNLEKQVEFVTREWPRRIRKSLDQEIMPSSLRKKRNHLPSNKVKLLKLKETLKQLQKGKKEEPDIAVSNAGMVIGWVLWKSVFTQFGWLQEGKFIRTESLDARQMAASWLHLSVGEDPINANPLILFMCGIEEYEINPMTKEELQEQLGNTDIAASINDYYEMLLSMWPIFEQGQIGDLIELFIRREGLMQPTGLGMKLKLVKEPYDLLMDRNPIPWPISLINFSWTTSIIEVEW